MAGRAIVDTGFLVALLDGRDEHHRWAAELVSSLRGPWLTAEACVSETIDEQPKLPLVTVDARDFAVYFRRRRGRKLLVPGRPTAR